jgi:membrane-bound serine protease (ClpP class)
MNRQISCFILLLMLAFTVAAQKKVVSVRVNGMINPASADYIHRGITRAAKLNAECLLIYLNTPGGLLNSTRNIVSDILESPVPVIVYVSPGGAHAGSAGVFITMAAHVAVMAPGTNIGAAHPVSSNQVMDTIMNEKVTNDATAFIRSIAEKRKRNVEWAVKAVSKSVSITENEAMEMKVINFIAINERVILDSIDGQSFSVKAGEKTVHTKNASIELVEMGWVENFLNVLSDPNIAYILFLLGLYGLMFELYSPGAIFPGIIGGICLILALYTMNTLPINYAGVALIIFAIILFLLEVKIVSHGMLAIGGVIAMLLGSMMLIRTDQEWDIARVSWGIIIPAVAITAIFFLFIVGLGLSAQRLQSTTGMEAMSGKTGEAITALNPTGSVLVHGEIWNATSTTGELIEPGKKIRVTSLKAFTLFVEVI